MKKKTLFMIAFLLGFHIVNAQEINDANILMYLDFEGDLLDSKGNFTFIHKTSGTAKTPIAFASKGGKFGQYGVFNNTAYESLNSVYNTSNSSTIAVWVRIDAAESIVNGQITHVMDMANGPAAGITDDGTAQLRFRSLNATSGDNNFASATTAVEQYSNAVATKEVWYHVALVHDAVNETQTFYINGVLDKVYDYSDEPTKPRNVQTEIILGANKVGNSPQALLGDIDDLLITSEILTLKQIQSVMNFGVEASKTGTTYVWSGNGDTDTTFGIADNWDPSGVPDTSANILIPNGLTNYPIQISPLLVGNIIVEKNASLNVGSNAVTATSTTVYGGGSIIAASISGSFTYNVITTIDNAAPPQTGGEFNPAVWNLMSSPVVGEMYDNDWIDVNNIGTGTGANRAIALYDNTLASGNWDYYQTNTAAETFNSGIGFSTRKKTVDYQNNDEEVYSFVGTFPDADVILSITQGAGSNWNLVGNPYPSYISAANLVANNTANLTTGYKALYIWDPADTSYKVLPGTHIAPGQGFFVNAANSDSNNFVIATSLQSHQTDQPFYKTSESKISLSISDGTYARATQINYASNHKLGLDEYSDIGMFTGVGSSFGIYSELLENNTGIALERQTLPNTDFESMIIPLGVIAESGKQIIFSADAQNLPSGINVYLEDKVANTYTLLDASSNYTVTLDTKQNGIGRFYLHTSASSVLSTENNLLETVSIYKTSNSTIRIAGLRVGKISFQLFNILGKQILNTSFTANGDKDISLPNLAPGVYLVKLQTESGSLSKKIILE